MVRQGDGALPLPAEFLYSCFFVKRLLFIVVVAWLWGACSVAPQGYLSLRNGAERYDVRERDGMPAGLDGCFWSYRLKSGKTLSSDYFVAEGTVAWKRVADSAVRFRYNDSLNRVVVWMALGQEGLDCRLSFEQLEEDVCEVAMPASADFSTATLEHVIFPNELGVRLKRSFYEEHSTPKIWTGTAVGPQVLDSVAGLLCVAEPNVNRLSQVSVTPLGRKVLDETLVTQWDHSARLVVRPALTKPDYDFVTAPEGSFWGGHRVGRGVLLRFGGKLRLMDGSAAIALAQCTIQAFGEGRLEGYAPAVRRTIGLLDVAESPRSTGWSEVSVDVWEEAFKDEADFRVLRSIPEALDFMRDEGTLAVINPYGEMLPVDTLAMDEMVSHIRTFLQGGGLWVETGGYPFFNALRPARFNTLSTSYPFAFSDFFEIRHKRSSLCIYGIQPEGSFIPLNMRTWADSTGGHLTRSWRVYIYKEQCGADQDIHAGKNGYGGVPEVRFVRNGDLPGDIRNYARANGFTKPLEEKMPIATLEKWKRSPILKFSGRTIAQQTVEVEKMPVPSIVHVWDYVKGGFDKLYPEHLPPHPERGTMADFEELIRVTHDRGSLFMPYTNNTWWCDGPPSQLLHRVGRGPLFRNAVGEPVKEDYAGNYGWSICPWHPEVIASGERIAREFSELGCDILFEDQVGAREWMGFDFNPCSPSPAAYHQGMINLALAASEYRPLATEQGYDRLINAQSEFCGLTWMLVPFKERPWWVSWWLRSYSDLFEPEDYEAYPLAQYVADGKTLFTHHLGGPLVENSENLAWTLLLGYQMIVDVPTAKGLSPERRRWINFLAEVQRTLGPAYMGVPMREFRYLSGSGNEGVVMSRFDQLTVVANLTGKTYRYRNCEIAPKGFAAFNKSHFIGYVNGYEERYFETPVYVSVDLNDKKIEKYEFDQ